MSLQVWLPLNGNLNNQGLSGYEMSVSTPPSYTNNGKIGRAVSTGAFYLKANQIDKIFNNTELSISFWIYPHSNTNGGILFGNDSSDTNGGRKFSIYLYPTVNDLHLSWQNGANTDTFIAKVWEGVFPSNQWTHCCITYRNPDCSVYINGTLTYTRSGVSNSSSFTYDTTILNNASNRYVNDLRIYNHCLSAKEVKEISKGLVCHYLMNQPEQSPNLSTLPSYIPDFPNGAGTSVYSRSTDGASRRLTCTTSGDGGLYNTCFSNSVRLENTVYTWSVDIRASRSMSVYVGLEGGGEENFNVTTNWQRISKTAVLSTNTYSAFIIYPGNAAAVGDWIEVKLLKVEKNNFATSWSPCSSDYPKWPDNIEYDCSGYRNDGNRIGGITLSNSPISIRYENYYSFDGDTGCVQIPDLSALVPSGEFTMNCWIYHDDTWSSKEYETIFGGPNGFELETKNKATNSPVLYAYSWGKGSATYELNKWNMITMTRNASEAKFYINGELKVTGSAGTIPSGNYFVGAWDTSSKQNYKGKISDFRLYSNVLSEEDIKTLYSISASIDKNGNMYAYEFKEE